MTDSTATKHRVATGGAWMIVFSVTGRVSRFVGQLVLAWLLVPEQFGLIGIAHGLVALVGVIEQFGLSDVLVNRYRRFHLWSSAGYSLSIILGFFTTAIMLLMAVGASYVYDEADIGWMIAIMSIGAPISALGILPFAKLRAEMDFRKIALVQSFGILLQMTSAVAFAAIGFGVYCIACAKLVDVSFRTYQWVRLAKLNLPRKFSLARVRYLMTESLHVYTQALFNNIVLQGDYLLLGLFVAKGVVGLYFMAYSLSVQAISLIALNLNTVLFSAYNTFSDSPERLTGAFVRSSKLLAFTCAPLCIMQVVLAAPVIHTILQPQWHDIVPLVQILSIGTAFRCASFSWESMLKAQRKFALVAQFSVIAAIVFLGVIAVGCYLGGVMGCAIACALYHAVISPLQLMLAMGFERGTTGKVLDLSFRSLGVSLVAFGAAWLLAASARNAQLPLAEAAIETIVGVGLYWVISRKVNSEPLNDFTEVIMQIIRKKRKTSLSPGT